MQLAQGLMVGVSMDNICGSVIRTHVSVIRGKSVPEISADTDFPMDRSMDTMFVSADYPCISLNVV